MNPRPDGEPIIPLVRHPELRAALRRLYPEYPAIIQAWLIAEPGAPLPELADYTLPIFTDTAAQEASFKAQLKDLREAYPEMQWKASPPFRTTRRTSVERTLVCDTRYFDDTDRAEILQELPADAVTSYLYDRPIDHYDPDELGAVRATVVRHGGLLEVEHKDGAINIRFEDRTGLFLDVNYDDDDTSSVHIGRMELPEVLADGSPTFLLGDRIPADHSPIEAITSHQITSHQTPHAPAAHTAPQTNPQTDPQTRTVPQGIQPYFQPLSHPQGNPIHVQRLLTRWRALQDDGDRRRIADFWLGHPHPTLATAGLALFTEQVRGG
jgi:hypothetical protein